MSVKELLHQNEAKDLLRFTTAGNVDDGKSTLIGRLLYDSKTLFEDHLKALAKDSAKKGSAGGEIDYSLLLDGLKAEREQGITIDVAYRYFATPKRKFIIADTPGHEQYTRNMATGASTANLAIILVDAAYGVRPQTKRHSFIASLLGIRHIVVAVNKMDLVDYDEAVFERIRADYADFSAKLEVQDIHFIPISALKGDNVVDRSTNMPWYNGAPLLDYLETVHIASDRNLIDMRFPVQYVLRPDLNFRGFSGSMASGILRVGDEVMSLPSGSKSHVKTISTYDGDVEEAFPPMSVTVTLTDEIDVSRGNMLTHVNNVPTIANRFEAMLVWMSQEPMKKGATYLIKHTTNQIQCVIPKCYYKVNVNTLRREQTEGLALNEIGRVSVEASRPLLFDHYAKNRGTGSFIIIDFLTNATVAAGMILDRKADELSPSSEPKAAKTASVKRQKSSVSREDRRARLRHTPLTIWFTGLPKSGKSVVAYALEKKLFDDGLTPYVLDGDNLRAGISGDLGFTGDERSENTRRAANIAKLFNDAGLITLVSLVSPFDNDRAMAREVVGSDNFILVHLCAPLEACERRDKEGLYEKARSGEIKQFSGITSPYEPPKKPDFSFNIETASPEEIVNTLATAVMKRCVQ